jgi:hypothetical protein
LRFEPVVVEDRLDDQNRDQYTEEKEEKPALEPKSVLAMEYVHIEVLSRFLKVHSKAQKNWHLRSSSPVLLWNPSERTGKTPIDMVSPCALASDLRIARGGKATSRFRNKNLLQKK